MPTTSGPVMSPRTSSVRTGCTPRRAVAARYAAKIEATSGVGTGVAAHGNAAQRNARAARALRRVRAKAFVGREHVANVVLRLCIRRNTAVTIHRAGAGIVGGDRQQQIAA